MLNTKAHAEMRQQSPPRCNAVSMNEALLSSIPYSLVIYGLDHARQFTSLRRWKIVFGVLPLLGRLNARRSLLEMIGVAPPLRFIGRLYSVVLHECVRFMLVAE
jgi:hypothetical protein